MSRIQDGTGANRFAQVDDHGRLYTLSNTITHVQHHAWYHKDAFIYKFEVTLPDTNETTIAFVKNVSGTQNFEFLQGLISCNADIEVNTYFNGVYTSGGSAITPLNTNRSSGNLVGDNIISYEGDMVIDSTNSEKFLTMYIAANSVVPVDFQGAIILGNTNTAYMTVKGATGTKVSFSVFSTSHSIDTLL